MAKKITAEQRAAVLKLLAQGHDSKTIATALGLTPAQVSAINAHLTMGRYRVSAVPGSSSAPASLQSRSENILKGLRQASVPQRGVGNYQPVLLGTDPETGELVSWNP